MDNKIRYDWVEIAEGEWINLRHVSRVSFSDGKGPTLLEYADGQKFLVERREVSARLRRVFSKDPGAC